MNDLSFEDALCNPDLRFARFLRDCVRLSNAAARAYEEAGSPLGPGVEGNNVTEWFMQRADEVMAVEEAERELGLR